MCDFEEKTFVMLKDSREIRLNDSGDISLSIISNRKTMFNLTVQYPDCGYGGGFLYLSPSNTYLIFTFYSGQGDESFILYRITETLEEIYRLCLCGEASSYGFSDDDKFLIQALPFACCEWWWLWEDEYGEKEMDEQGRQYFDLGNVNVLDIENKDLSEHIIRIYPTDKWNPVREEYNPFWRPQLIENKKLEVSLPWGTETLDFPLKDIIIYEI
jgi:hypothetical protein